MKMKIAECNKCKQAVYWAKSKKTGSNMMFDVEPGTSTLHKWQLFDDEGVLKAEFVGGGGDDLRSSHFDTCPAKDGGGTRRQAAETRRSAEPARRAAPEPVRRGEAPVVRFESVSLEPDSIAVTLEFRGLVFVGICKPPAGHQKPVGWSDHRHSSHVLLKRSDADDSEDIDL